MSAAKYLPKNLQKEGDALYAKFRDIYFADGSPYEKEDGTMDDFSAAINAYLSENASQELLDAMDKHKREMSEFEAAEEAKGYKVIAG